MAERDKRIVIDFEDGHLLFELLHRIEESTEPIAIGDDDRKLIWRLLCSIEKQSHIVLSEQYNALIGAFRARAETNGQ